MLLLSNWLESLGPLIKAFLCSWLISILHEVHVMLLPSSLLHITRKIENANLSACLSWNTVTFSVFVINYTHNIQNNFFLFFLSVSHQITYNVYKYSGYILFREGIGCGGNRTLEWEMQVYNQNATVLNKIVWFCSTRLKDFLETVYANMQIGNSRWGGGEGAYYVAWYFALWNFSLIVMP